MTQDPDNTDFRPPGWPTVTPRIMAHGAEMLVAFVKEVFRATGDYRPEAPAELRIGDSIIMISEVGVRERMPACLYVYVENADLTWQRAVKAGAQSLESPSNTPYGDRRAIVKDRWGNSWQIATRMRVKQPPDSA
jgi:PhnB protein